MATTREARTRDGQILDGPHTDRAVGKNALKVEESLDHTSVGANEGMPSKKKKKKKSAGTKLERRMKREEEQLRALYGPKDSHVKLISASMLEKLQGVRHPENSSTKFTMKQEQQSQQDKSYNSLFADNDFPSFSSSTKVKSSSVATTTTDEHFPSLLTTSSDPVVVKNVNITSSPGPLQASEQICPGSSKKRLSKKPMVISLDDLILKKPAMKDLSLPKVKKRADLSNVTVGNTLDSSGPIFIHRGKMREKPKQKRPTKLKMTIMKSRSIKVEQINSPPSDLLPTTPTPATPATTTTTQEEVICKAKESLHTRKFKPYCDMYTSKELHGHVIALLKELHRFQDRLYHSDPIKYKTKRRFIHGIKDTINSLKINKVVLIIFAPDIESNNSEGGLDEKINEIKSLAKEKHVPVIYSGNRFVLGKPIFCKTAVSVISILDRQGAESLYFKVLEEADRLREKYEANLAQKIQEIVDLKS